MSLGRPQFARLAAVFLLPLLALPAWAEGAASRFVPLFSPSVAADLDGDRAVDIAMSGASRHEGQGYVQEIRFWFSGVTAASTITVRTGMMAGRLTADDLDGDADRDLVLETLDREPLAVLLNDGGGHFHEGRIEDFRFRLAHRNQQSLTRRAEPTVREEGVECSSSQIAVQRLSISQPDFASRLIPSGRERNVLLRRPALVSTRGPPAQS